MINDLTEDLKTLALYRVFFGHQSVGSNIIDGLDDLLRETRGVNLSIYELRSFSDISGGCFIHAKVGNNEKPLSKCREFAHIIDKNLSGKIDFALLKFCYIDINRHSNIEKLFIDYQNALDDLRKRHPEITFIHCTVPLKHCPGGPGVWLREMLGRPNNSKLDNLKRNEFNRLVLGACNFVPVIDVAGIESTYPDGKSESFKINGQTCFSLIRDYTDDGGHLNELGRKHVATKFASDLARIIRNYPRQNRQ